MDPIESGQVGNGVWAIVLPASKVYFRHSIAYLVETGVRPVLIDAGEASEEAWQALVTGVAASGHTIADIEAVLLTHGHFDHCGAAARIRDLSGAWIAMSEAEEDFHRRHRSDSETRQQVYALCLRAGADPSDLPTPVEDEDPSPPISVAPDIHLTHGQSFTIGTRTFEVVMTPGHSPGHAAFLLADERLLFGGDHLFPQGSTIVLLIDIDGPPPLNDPLGDYLASLDRIGRADIHLVLPGHIGPFSNFAERIDRERRRCLERLDEIRLLIGKVPVSPAEIAGRIRWGKREWGDLAPGVRQAAILNSLTAIRALEARGEVCRADAGGRIFYRRVSETMSQVA